MIPEEIIAEIRERTDIVALIQEYVALKQAGTSFKGLCPFHSEKTPSFHVHRDRQFFYCFGCQASGDIFRFLMMLEGRSFPDAVRGLAERAAIEIPEDNSRDGVEKAQQRKRESQWYQLLEAATVFFEQQLESEAGGAARDELMARGIEGAAAQRFRLGYAPSSWDALTRTLQTQGFSPSAMETLGLAVPRKRDGHYDRFRHRLMFPIADHQGRVVAFSGRALPAPEGEEEKNGNRIAKYVNSPEGPLYQKGRTLYGLHQARVALRREGCSVLCEGNFDLVALHQAGFEHVVAPLGTALTKRQCELLKRYSDRVILLFDGDRAGREAARKAAPLLFETGLRARVVNLPDGSDPDAFLREKGREAVAQLLEHAPGMMEFLIDQEARGSGASAAERADAVGRLGPLLMHIDSPVEVGLYIERIGQKFGIADLGAVRTQLRRGVRLARAGRSPGEADKAEGRSTEHQKPRASTWSAPSNSKMPKLEAELVGALLDNPVLLGSEAAEKLQKLLTNGDLRAIFNSALRVTSTQPALTVPALLEDLSTHSTEHTDTLSVAGRHWCEQRLISPELASDTAEQTLQDGVTRLERFSLESRLPMLGQQIMDAQRRGDRDEAARLLRERDELRRAAVKLQGKLRGADSH